MLTLKQLDKTFGAGTASAHHALCGTDLNAILPKMSPLNPQ